jgi:hypothetical protein
VTLEVEHPPKGGFVRGEEYPPKGGVWGRTDEKEKEREDCVNPHRNVRSQQAQFSCPRQHLRAAIDAQLVEHLLHMRFDRTHCDDQPVSNLLIR